MNLTGRRPALPLEVENLIVRFPDSRGRTFTPVDLPRWSMANGAATVITGPSGAGKSTLLYALAGLVRPDTGRISWGGTDIVQATETARDGFRRRHFGFVFQDFHLIQELSSLENVLLPARFESIRTPLALRLRAEELLDHLGVPSARRHASDLSRGEQQRVALARALLFDPPVLLADEPTASLDEAAGIRVIDDLFSDPAAQRRTIIVVSHDPLIIGRCSARLHMVHGHGVEIRQPAQGGISARP